MRFPHTPVIFISVIISLLINISIGRTDTISGSELSNHSSHGDTKNFEKGANRRLYDSKHGQVGHHVKLHEFMDRIDRSLDDDVVDRTTKEMESAYHKGNLCPFKRSVSSKMLKGETIEVVIVGGSVTYGADLGDREKERWSHSFTEILNSGWYTGTINVRNIGVGACNLDVWIDKVNEVKDADMVIVDMSVNDQGFDLQGLPLLYQTFLQLIDNMPKHPAILVHYAFRTGKTNKEEFGHCPNERDQGTCCGGYLWCKRWWDMQDFAAITFKKFQIPFVSFRDLVWPVYEQPPDALPQIWNGLSHPDKRAHKLFAKLISFAFMKQLKEAHTHSVEECGLAEDSGEINITKSIYVTGENVDPSVQPLCSLPLTHKRATDQRSSYDLFLPVLPIKDEGESKWRYYNDSKSKYGWILETNKSSITSLCSGSDGDNDKWCEASERDTTISFEVELSSDYVIQIAYLKSYPPHYGRARVWIDDRRDYSVVLSGRWEEDGRVLEYSVTRIATIFSSDAALMAVNPTIAGETHLFLNNGIPWQQHQDFATGESTSMAGSTNEADALILAPGKHTVHISGTQFETEKYKWKLLGIRTC